MAVDLEASVAIEDAFSPYHATNLGADLGANLKGKILRFI